MSNTKQLIYSWHQALLAAGSADSDSVLVQDEMLQNWIGNRTMAVIANESCLPSCSSVDLVIIKEKSNDQS